ncbi:trypsin-like peptidase domain-containing protein [Candidatus Parcubacteria bacterium]|nr:trypsin-like peptidase domain-containing protein [Candidatus Parcubacteria bacterium]
MAIRDLFKRFKKPEAPIYFRVGHLLQWVKTVGLVTGSVIVLLFILVFYQFRLTQSLKTQVGTLENKLSMLATSPSLVSTSTSDDLTRAVAKVSPGVVSIVISQDVPKMQVQYINPFGSSPEYRNSRLRIPVYKQVGTEKQDTGAGSGFIVRSDGYIITNSHVVEDDTATYTVLLSSGEEKVAHVVSLDQADDIAVIKIDASNLPTVPLGESSNLVLGQTVAAIGNALGEYSNSVSVGIVSGLDRTIEAGDYDGNVETLSGVIQTDAAINPGNSGGPLLDLNGEVTGVNVATVRGSNNISFAVPIDVVKNILKNLNIK